MLAVPQVCHVDGEYSQCEVLIPLCLNVQSHCHVEHGWPLDRECHITYPESMSLKQFAISFRSKKPENSSKISSWTATSFPSHSRSTRLLSSRNVERHPSKSNTLPSAVVPPSSATQNSKAKAWLPCWTNYIPKQHHIRITLRSGTRTH